MNRPSSGVDRLTAESAVTAAVFSAVGRVAYIEVEVFGGTGTQAALGWEHGLVALEARRSRTHVA